MHDIFSRRQTEGSFSILIERYLFSDHDKFTAFLRVSPRTFYIILKHIYNDIYVPPTNRIKNPIDPSQKLCIALRYYNVFIHFSLPSSFIILLLLFRRFHA